MPRTLVISRLLLLALTLTTASCNRSTPHPSAPAPRESAGPALDDWIGVYASPSEITGFSRTVLVLEKDHLPQLAYRMRYHSDRVLINSIEQDELSGRCMTSGTELFLPSADGYYDDEKKPQLTASIDRYTMEIINGRRILMRDDAREAYRRDNKLYDYGILILTEENPGWKLDLNAVAAPSIKLLYQDPAKPWQDPYVHGPNSR